MAVEAWEQYWRSRAYCKSERNRRGVIKDKCPVRYGSAIDSCRSIVLKHEARRMQHGSIMTHE